MTFPESLSRLLKGGANLRRVSWGGGVYIQVKPAWIDENQVHHDSHIVMVTPSREFPWLPSTDDLFTTDWVVHIEQPELGFPETSP